MSFLKIFFASLMAGVCWLAAIFPGQAALTPANLQCEYRVNPLGIDAWPPRLTWQVQSVERDQRQTAYEIIVASDEKSLGQNIGDLWDSGKIPGDQTINVEYAGQTLSSREVCFWKVKVWDQQDTASDWSAPARWSMGLLNSNDWPASYYQLSRHHTGFHQPGQALPAGGASIPQGIHHRESDQAGDPLRHGPGHL